MTLLHLTPDNRQIKTTIMVMLGRAFMLCNQHKAKSSHDHKSVGLRKILLPSSPSSPSWQCPQCWEWQLQLQLHHSQQGGRFLGPRLRWRGLLPPWVLHHLLSSRPAQHRTDLTQHSAPATQLSVYKLCVSSHLTQYLAHATQLSVYKLYVSLHLTQYLAHASQLSVYKLYVSSHLTQYSAHASQLSVYKL